VSRIVILAVLTFAVLGSTVARAAPHRYALIVGNNRGNADELSLRYAESDARKVFDTVTRLGDVPRQNAVLSTGATAAEVRSALIELNREIRERMQGGDDAILLVYYSGHGDDRSLHLEGTELDLGELRSLVLASAATVRVLVLDSCRSGALARSKGGRPGERFRMRVDDRLHATGAVVITASAANEDAQESDDLGGSIFTHHFVSGLLGAADATQDGRVSLAEAYSYAYERTVTTSSRSAAAPQHPTYSWSVKGMGEVVLTSLDDARARSAALVLEDPGHYFIFRGDKDGPLVAEVAASATGRRLLLPAGSYFVRKRAANHLREGAVLLSRANPYRLRAGSLRKIGFAPVVRKGGAELRVAHSVRAGVAVRGGIVSGFGPQTSAQAAYELTLPAASVGARFWTGTSSSENDFVEADLREFHLDLRLSRAVDLGRWTVSGGAVGGVSLFRQEFDTERSAPAQTSAAVVTGLSLGVERALAGRWFASAQAEALTYVLRERGRSPDSSISTPLTYSVAISVGAFL